MMTKSILPAVAAGLLFAASAGAQPGDPGADPAHLAVGGSAGVRTLPDGRTVATLGRKSKTCKPGQIPIATSARATITTTRGTKIYPEGLVACLDPADFGGASAMSIDGGGVVLKPSNPDTH